MKLHGTFFHPAVYYVAYLLAAALIIGLVILLVGERHERRRVEAQVCAARLDAWKARDPFAARIVMPADPCVALRVVTR